MRLNSQPAWIEDLAAAMKRGGLPLSAIVPGYLTHNELSYLKACLRTLYEELVTL